MKQKIKITKIIRDPKESPLANTCPFMECSFDGDRIKVCAREGMACDYLGKDDCPIYNNITWRLRDK